jgi:crossover junction endodeoxyribonuclease RuvC
MIILAIDPGYERLGVAILEKQKAGKEILLYSDCFITPKNVAHSERLKMVGNEINRLIEKYSPDALALETLFFSKNQKTALQVAETRGVILFCGALHSVTIKEYHPADIKIAVTGYGKSDKEHVTAMIPKLIAIDKKIRYDDEYDAIAVGLTYFATERGSYPQK